MPDWKRLVREKISPLNLTGTAEQDLVEELAEHLEDYYRELLSGGATADEAYRTTLAELADAYALREGRQKMPKQQPIETGDARPANFVDDLWRDLRYAARTMRRSPLFVVFVVLTLALGIGANTTVFTLINTLILNPLPVENISALESVATADAAATSKSSVPMPLSYADLKDFQARNEVFSSLAGYTSVRTVTWQTNGVSQRLFTELATGNYFSTLGLTPAMGRFFSAEEDSVSSAHPVAVLNYGTWQSNFGADPAILGKTLQLNHVMVTVIGVAPPKFIGVNGLFGPDMWIPAAMAEQILPNEMHGALTDRSKAIFQGVGRLKAGANQTLAQANLTTIAANLGREYSSDGQARAMVLRPVRDVLFSSTGTGSSTIMFASAVLLIVVGIVLLIACSNVANLLMARSASRQQEIAVRLAMGASRRRLVRQLLTESMLLGLLSGVLGLAIGYGGLRALFGTLPGAATFVSPKWDWTVFLFTLLISLATGVLFGTIPALRASAVNVGESLKESARTTGRNRSKVSLANALLVTQVAFSFLLLVTAALFLRSIQSAYRVDPGFQTAHLAVFITNPGQAGYGKTQTKAFYDNVRERLMRMPGIESVSWSSNQPLWARPSSGLEVEGWQQRSKGDRISTVVSTVDRDYFRTMGMPIDKGREFSSVDQENTIPVAIVNEKLAHDFWPAGDALGKRILLPGEKERRQIIGVARTANYTSWAEAPQLCVYIPLAQKYLDGMTLYVRSKGEPQQILIPVQREVTAAGPEILASSVRTGREIVDGGLFQAKIGVALLSVFGLLALVLASIGLYGILAFSVSQRKREIGLRMALGAAQSGVLRLILKQGMTLVVTGMLIGFAGALIVGRLLSRMLYGVGASDPISLAAAAAVLLTVALLACYLPARWASRVDPLVALREG